MVVSEQWRAVLDGRYEVSSAGRVRRALPGRGSTFVGRLLTPHSINAGHLIISVWDKSSKKRTWVLVHVLVAAAFIGPLPNGKEVNHIDGNPKNNAACNLEYVTHAENIRHGHRNKRGERNHMAKTVRSGSGRNQSTESIRRQRVRSGQTIRRKPSSGMRDL